MDDGRGKTSEPRNTRAKETTKVEILKFSEPPKRSTRSSSRNRNGFMRLLAVVVGIAVIGGMSSTLAGTITLNSGSTVEFGQGIVTAAACDSSVTITPSASYESDTAKASTNFLISTIQVKNLGLSTGGGNGTGCKGKWITIKAYAQNSNTPLVFDGTHQAIKFQMPNTDTLTAGTQITKDSNSSSVVIADGGISGMSTAFDSDDTNGYFTLTGISILSTAVRFTVESSDS